MSDYPYHMMMVATADLPDYGTDDSVYDSYEEMEADDCADIWDCAEGR